MPSPPRIAKLQLFPTRRSLEKVDSEGAYRIKSVEDIDIAPEYLRFRLSNYDQNLCHYLLGVGDLSPRAWWFVREIYGPSHRQHLSKKGFELPVYPLDMKESWPSGYEWREVLGADERLLGSKEYIELMKVAGADYRSSKNFLEIELISGSEHPELKDLLPGSVK